MKLTKEFLKEKDACAEGYKYALDNLIGLEPEQVIGKLIQDKKFDWGNWYLTRLFTKEQNVEYAIYSVKLVLPIFEKEYPEDKSPRQAIEAAEKWLKKPTEENMQEALTAARAAARAYAHTATYAYAAAAAAAAAAARAAYAAAYTATYAYAYAYAAAAAATYYTFRVENCAETYIKILRNGLEILKRRQ